MTAFTICDVRVFDGRRTLEATHVRVAGGLIAAVGGAGIVREGDRLVDGRGGTLLPGLIDAHVHLLPGCTRLAALFGVTTVIDQFSKPEVIGPETADGRVRAGVRTSGIGATAPGGHPTMAYAPLPYVTGPADAASFVRARVDEGAAHLKVIYDDGAGAALPVPALEPATIEALVREAHRHGLPVVAHASTAEGAVTVARCGVDVLAHAPFDRMSGKQVAVVAAAGCAVIATLGVVDGFPGADGVMPLLAEPELAGRVPARWRKVLEDQSRRWMPPEPPDGAVARENTGALFGAGVPVLAGTDSPNPGLVFGASLHRELGHLAAAGLRPVEVLAAATAVPAEVFGLGDRGRVEVGRRADLVMVGGDPTVRIEDTRALGEVWAGGRRVDPAEYPGSRDERDGVRWLRAVNDKIVVALRERWPEMPVPEPVVRADGEPLGRVVPVAGGWQAVTVFGAPLGGVAGRDEAVHRLQVDGLSCLAEPWWARRAGGREWERVRLLEVRPDRVRLRWADPMVEQGPSGEWFDVDDLDLAFERPS